MRTFLFAILFLLSCSHKQDTSIPLNQTSPLGPLVERPWLQNGCTLYKFLESVKTFPGDQCVFFPDGSFISASKTMLRKFSPGHEIVWEIPGHFHHQLNLSPDKARILTLSSDVYDDGKRKWREDVFLIVSLEGKVLFRRGVRSILKEKGMSFLKNYQAHHMRELLKIDAELSHFNSIYEIPLNQKSKEVNWLRPGNIILNGLDHGIFILTPDLSRVVYHLIYPYSWLNSIHDVQVTEAGEFLIFNNVVFPSSEQHSAIQKYDPIKKILTFNFTATPKVMFFSPASGGVQEIGDEILFSHITAGAYVYSKKEEKMIRYFPGTNGDARLVSPIQQVKMPSQEVIQSFLSNQK